MVARELFRFGCLAKRVHCRRYQRHHRDFFFDHQRGELLYLESRHQHQRRAQHQRRIQNYVQPVDVIQRKKTQDAILARKKHRVRTEQLVNVRDQIKVRKHHPLGQSGGTAGIRKCCQSLGGRVSWLRQRGRYWLQQVAEALRAGRRVARSVYAAQIRQSAQVYSFEIATIADQQHRARILQLVSNFSFAVRRIQQGRNRSRQRGRMVSHGELPRICQKDGDYLARIHSCCNQPSGERFDDLSIFGVSKTPAA